ncbi:MAG: DUF4982 domain-containing protein [Bacteroidales bacterium]|nr:DUF4982 domain-containing protein [Bacteroidales bacterium]
MKKFFLLPLIAVCVCACSSKISIDENQSDRVVISLNKDWKFALGHTYDRSADFNNGTSYFSYVTKAGFGDGPANAGFDDRMWRTVDVPHDWCVELPFAPDGSVSHGSKAIGNNYPENSIGWYRKTFFADSTWLGKKISVEFEGVFRNSKVWLNGFYLGEEPSGYTSFNYDLTEYLNFGGENVLAVRADASFEEGWFYEGAGIYRNVNLIVTNPVHIARNGTFVTTDKISDSKADLTARTTIQNETNTAQKIIVVEKIFDAEHSIVAENQSNEIEIKPLSSHYVRSNFSVRNPKLWEVWDYGTPYLYTLETYIYNVDAQKVIDKYSTQVGIRTVAFDAQKGFFLNGRSVKVRGVCLHQDHAGVGVALTPSIQEFRIAKMQEMGCNAIRTSHNPASPDFLKACDKMGMLVMEEARLMGINKLHQHNIEEMICRDRNHPSIFIWSLGNEEWAIEGNEKGALIARNMENFARQLDSTRAFTIASSGGWDNGIGKATEVCGINYISHGDVIGHHEKYPNQPLIGTEESNTERTRGIYETNDSKCWMARAQVHPQDSGMCKAWKFYDSNPWASGLFYWTGLDYRGEPTPYEYPAVVSQFGITDLCGYKKDNFYYLQSWWTEKPVLHIATNWNYSQQTDSTEILVYSNCPEVELFVNETSVGKQTIEKNDYAQWTVKYAPGTISAIGYDKDGNRICGENDGKSSGISKIQTKAEKQSIALEAYSTSVAENDVAIITATIRDEHGNVVPTAMNTLTFSVDGQGEIIGVGNGNPSSHEPEVFTDTYSFAKISGLKELTVNNLQKRPETALHYNYTSWIPAFSNEPKDWLEYTDTLKVIRGVFTIDSLTESTIVTLFAKSILDNQSIFVNGHLLQTNLPQSDKLPSVEIPKSYLNQGINEFAVTGQKLHRPNQWDFPNQDPGVVQIIHKAPKTTRNLFNGYAQVLVRITGNGNVTIKAHTNGLSDAKFTINN